MKSCQSRRQDSKYQNRKNHDRERVHFATPLSVFLTSWIRPACVVKHVMRQLPSALHLKQRNNRTSGELKLEAEKYSYCINN